jgi:HKD family nuclease
MTELILTNPITSTIKNSIEKSTGRVLIAVPFLTGYVRKIINENKVKSIKDKRIITRFDASSITSFDIPALKYLLDCGYEIRYDNTIHLKLYIFDEDVFVTSSNLTQGGFENNKELTVKTDSSSTENCIQIFDELWQNCENTRISYELLELNLKTYDFLRKKEKFRTQNKPPIQEITNIKLGDLDITELKDLIIGSALSDNVTETRVYKANKLRNNFLSRLRKEFDSSLIFSDKDQPNYKKDLHYVLLYGSESRLANTGLRDKQVEQAFTSQKFIDAMYFFLPEIIGQSPWDLENETTRLEFCQGLFDFDIPQYKESLPIRIASYLYPEKFLPIFNLNHLQKVCQYLGLKSSAKTRGERLFAYNKFLSDELENIQKSNYLKSHIIYEILFTVILHTEISSGKSLREVINSGFKKWEKDYINKAYKNLLDLKIIQ